MPIKATSSRAQQLATLEEVIHDRKLEPNIPIWIEEAYSKGNLTKVESSNLNEALRIYKETSKVPKQLCVELVKKIAIAQNLWINARKTNQTNDFNRALRDVISLKRYEADCLRDSEQDRYEALLQKFEPGQNNADLKKLLNSLREPLKSLWEKIENKKRSVKNFSGEFEKSTQLKISREIASNLLYDFDAGRLDESLHPFSSGHRTDARITTRVDGSNPLSCISSVMHEVGHALYEQGIPKELYTQPVGTYCSMGFHESQSRLIENQIGRSFQYCEYLFPILKGHFPEIDISSAFELYDNMNKVVPNYIRVDADEVTYNLHVLIRYELEEKLISGGLNVEDLNETWNTLFYRNFNIKINSPNHGFLQDIHWASGLFGYFPTYALGNLYAACIFKKMSLEIANLHDQIKRGQFTEIVLWLRKNIHNKARTMQPLQLLKSSTGEELSTKPFIEYLENKFLHLHNI